MSRLQTVLMRASHQETTGAIVSCEKTADVNTAEKMLEKIKRAVADWIKVTKEGTHQWENSSEDFNIGDLSMCYTDTDLTKFLKRHGINKLEIWTFVGDDMNHGYTYDTILVDTSRLED